MKIKTLQYCGFMIFAACRCLSQESGILTIEQCYARAKQNYPMIKQSALIEKARAYTVDNAAKGYLPQVNFSGQATYQSAVTQIPISLPNVNIPTLSKDQYRVYGEISQSLTDPLIIKQQKEQINVSAAAEVEKIEVELYKLKERINQLYFGMLLIDAQLQQNELLKKDMLSAIKKTEAAIANGTALKTNADLLSAELLKADQRTIELKANRKGYSDMLSVFINQPVSESTGLTTPAVQVLSASIARPELKLFEAQKKNFDIQNNLLFVKNLPRLNLFFQGGYGRPTLNLLNNDFGTYYIGGARFTWNISGFYTYKKEKRLQNINQSLIDNQKEIFLFNTDLTLKQQNAEISKLSELIYADNQIILLREKIKNTGNNQLENGTITSFDYLNLLNSEDQAKQNLSLHKIQLLMAQYNYQITSGN